MIEKKYPADIYPEVISKGGEERASVSKYFLQAVYDLGFEHGKEMPKENALEWSNLTDAIQAGERIDWERLDGLEAKCVHPKLGSLTYKLERDICYSETSFNGWYLEPVNLAWENAILDAWQGTGGWSLWVKGDLPLRKLTADELEPGTCFRARYKKKGGTRNYAWAQLLKPCGQKPRVIFFSMALTTLFGSALPEDVEVIEVYGVGAFQTHKENQ